MLRRTRPRIADPRRRPLPPVDEEDLKRFALILRLSSLDFSLHSITESLKRPLEPVDGGHRFSTESPQQIRDPIAPQVDALDARIEAVRREVKEVQALRAKLALDFDYLEQRLAGENTVQLLEQRRHAQAKKAGAGEKPTIARGKRKGKGKADTGTPSKSS